jgi:large subunit ribosomal protein L18
MHSKNKNKRLVSRQRRAKKSRMQIRNQAKEVLEGAQKVVRLTVCRTPQHIYIQAVDDKNSVTLASASTVDKLFKEKTFENKVEAALTVGKQLGKQLETRFKTTLSSLKFAFDRSGYRYHGRVKALAEGVRSTGIVF